MDTTWIYWAMARRGCSHGLTGLHLHTRSRRRLVRKRDLLCNSHSHSYWCIVINRSHYRSSRSCAESWLIMRIIIVPTPCSRARRTVTSPSLSPTHPDSHRCRQRLSTDFASCPHVVRRTPRTSKRTKAKRQTQNVTKAGKAPCKGVGKNLNPPRIGLVPSSRS